MTTAAGMSTKSHKKEDPLTNINTPTTKPAQIRLTRRSPAYCKARAPLTTRRSTFMGPEMVREFQAAINSSRSRRRMSGSLSLTSAVDDYFLNHSDFTAKLERLDLDAVGSHRLAATWPDFLARLTRLPVALHRPHPWPSDGATEVRSRWPCDMSFASREKARSSRSGRWAWGWSPGAAPMARLPRLISRNRALEVLIELGGHQRPRAGRGLRLRESRASRCRTGGVRPMRSAMRIAPGSTNGRSPTPSVSSTPACRRTSSLVRDGMRALLPWGGPAAQDGIKALMARGVSTSRGMSKTGWDTTSALKSPAEASGFDPDLRMEGFMEANTKRAHCWR